MKAFQGMQPRSLAAMWMPGRTFFYFSTNEDREGKKSVWSLLAVGVDFRKFCVYAGNAVWLTMRTEMCIASDGSTWTKPCYCWCGTQVMWSKGRSC
jgi:hypothetical protein